MLTRMAETECDHTNPSTRIIHLERRWFEPSDDPTDPGQHRISASRWVGHANEDREQETKIAADRHVVGIALRPLQEVSVFAAGKLILNGPLPRGGMRVNEPGLALRGIFRGAYDVLHLHLPNAMIAEYFDARGEAPVVPRFADRPLVDPVIERLGSSLIHAEELGGAFGRSYADGISLAMIAQLFGREADGRAVRRQRVSGLPKWRLKRATEFMAANLAKPIGLADIAAAAGLSRMHFAAQFRVATGLRPHEYLVQRRIDRARDLLLNSSLPLVEIAFEVGFSTQAHFTTVFARIVGETPNAWRQRNQSVWDMPIARAA
jgi:AraC-like DNA-binding protein